MDNGWYLVMSDLKEVSDGAKMSTIKPMYYKDGHWYDKERCDLYDCCTGAVNSLMLIGPKISIEDFKDK